VKFLVDIFKYNLKTEKNKISNCEKKLIKNEYADEIEFIFNNDRGFGQL
jgi:hypothetical protein